MIKKNDIILTEIDGMTAEGSGVAHPDGFAVFIKGAALSDKINARIIKVNKKYAIAKIDEIITPSPDRIENDCPSFPSCGGCAFRHISYDAECEIKQQRVADAMQRIGSVDTPTDKIVTADNIYGYRNKAQYAVSRNNGALKIGFYAERSHRVIDCRNCRLQPEIFRVIIDIFAEFIEQNGISVYDESSGKGLLRNIYIRQAEMTGEIMVCAVINGNSLQKSEALIEALKSALGNRLKTVILNINKERTNVILGKECKAIYGDGYITDILCGVKIRLNALSFYQVNRKMAERLYEIAADLAECDQKIVFDLYCGAGTIGLSMAKRAKRIIGAEIIPEAVVDAEFNAAANGIENAEFICADAADAAKKLAKKGIKPDVVIVDPPRKGLEEGLPEFIAAEFMPERIVYVSCDPATLARDAAKFEASGYKVKKIVPVDLFPRTHHVETVVLLSRKDVYERIKFDVNVEELMENLNRQI